VVNNFTDRQQNRHTQEMLHQAKLFCITYRVSHNTWDYKNTLERNTWERPLNDTVESGEVSHFEAKDHTGCQVLKRGLFCNKLFQKTNDPKFG
jgi:hypothetical protein